MTQPRHVAVIDIGKTNAKVAVVDLERLEEIDVLSTPNLVLPGPPYPHYDTDGLWRFICDGLAAHHRSRRIDAISVTTHGASIALLDEVGVLAAPVLDYEHNGPDDLSAAYDALRPDFSETGSPRLPMGLNVGAQLHWLLQTVSGLRDRVSCVVTYPQYWVSRLTGVQCTEVTSLGCHTDLWAPEAGRFTQLPERLGLDGKMAPVRHAPDRIGTLLPQVAVETGLPAGTPVYCGIHDSNASLYPHLLALKPPFSVLSTGTWVIAMGVGASHDALDPDRDTLINVNALGTPVPSARFMGGREFEILSGHTHVEPTPEDVNTVLARNIHLLPSVVPESGPFQGRLHAWNVDDASLEPGQRAAAIALYLALMAATCLRVIGACGPTLTEGPFARNQLFLEMLAAATGRSVLLPGGSATGTSIGAALLVRGETDQSFTESLVPHPVAGSEKTTELKRYAAKWRCACEGTTAPDGSL